MAVGSDVHDILDVFLIQNLSNITNERLVVTAPLGIQVLINNSVIDNVTGLGFASDLRELLVDYVLTRRLGDRISSLTQFRYNQIGIKKQQREFFR